MTQPPTGPPVGPASPGEQAGPTAEWAIDDWPERPEPTDAELHALWPDELAGPPDGGDTWLADLSAAELDALYGNTADEGQERPSMDQAAATGFAAGGWLDELVPGPVLSAYSQDAVDSGLGSLSDDELVGLLRAARRISSWQAAVEFRAVGELDARRLRDSRRPGWSRVSEHISSELAAALTLTGRSADILLGTSRDLARLPAVLRALAEGRIDRARAEIFATELAALSNVTAAAIAAALCDRAGSMTTGQLRSAIRAMVLAVDPTAVRRRAAKARDDARLETWPEGSGNTGIAGRELPSADAIAADRRIAAIARALKDAGARGTMDQLRASVFLALLSGRDPESLYPAADVQPAPAEGQSLTGATGPGRPCWGTGGVMPGLGGSVNLTMPLSAWLGDSDAPGEVAGLGPLDADTCRELADRSRSGPFARWCVTLTGRDGRAVAHACSRSGPGPPGRRRAWLARLTFATIESGVCSHRRQVPGYRPNNLAPNPGQGAAADLLLSRLPAARGRLRRRSHDPVRQGRHQLRVQSGPALQEAPQGEAGARLAA